MRNLPKKPVKRAAGGVVGGGGNHSNSAEFDEMEEAESLASGEQDLGAFVKARYGRSQQPEHQHLCAVAAAMAEVLREQGLEPSPTAYFGACMSTLERQKGNGNVAVITALCTFLSLVLPKLAPAVVRAKGDATLQLLVGLMSNEAVDQGAVKSGLLCIVRVVQGMDKSTWLGFGPSFQLLLRCCVDRHPKVRKRAHECLSAVLLWMRGSPSLPLASDVVVSLFDMVAAPIRENVGAGKFDNKADPGTGHSSALELLHVLGALKHVLPLLSKKAISKILPGLRDLYELRHPLLTRHVLATLQALCKDPTAEIVGAGLWDVLQKVASQLSAEKTKDVDELTVGARVLQQGLERLHTAEPALSAAKFPAVFHALTELLASEREEVVYTATECLRSSVQNCLDEQMVQQAVGQLDNQGQPNRVPIAVERVCATAETMLGYQYSTAWDMSLQVIADLFEKLGRASARLMPAVVKGLADLQELRDQDISCRKQLHKTLGTAVASMGPENFLELLPLNMDVYDFSESRTWLLPILKQHIVGSSLQYFVENMVPLASRLHDRALKHAAEGKPIGARNAESLSQSIWSLLPSFCNYPVDTATSFRHIAKSLGDILTNEPELRGIVCFSLQRLVLQNKLARGDDVENLPRKGLADHTEDLTTSEEKARSLYTAEVAASNIAAIAGFARNFLPLLFNLFIQSTSEKRGDLQDTISVIASIASQPTIKEFFISIMRKLLEATTEAAASGGSKVQKVEDSPAVRISVFMDLALSLTQGLDEEAVTLLFTTAKPALQDADARVQKKAYKLLSRLLKEHSWFFESRLEDVLETIVEAMVSCHSSAKRHRLSCLQSIIIHLSKLGDSKRDEAVAALLSEIILATKESNTKTRNSAYDLLIGIGHSMGDSEKGGSIEELLKFFNMILGSLAATSPHTKSAAVAGLARLLYEFSSELCHTVPDLLPIVLLMLRSQSREVVKSVLGLVKVIIVRLPGEELQKYLKSIVEGLLLWSDDSKNHFKAKVRTIMERLVRRCGLESVSAVMPQEHVKLLTHIRKTNEKAQKKKKAADEGIDDAKSVASSRASTARRSEWRHTEIFSDDDDESAEIESRVAGTVGAKTSGTARSFGTSRTGKVLRSKKQLPEEMDGSMGDPLDLLDNQRTREALSNRKPSRRQDDSDDDMEVDHDGRLIIVEDDDRRDKKRKRGRPEEEDEDDVQTQSRATSNKKTRKGADGKPIKDKTAPRKFHSKEEKGWAYTGEDYANKKGKSGGDVQRKGKMEPYAYWPLDQKLLNRREGKKSTARKGMESVVKATRKLQGMSVNKALGERVAQRKISSVRPKKHKQKQK